MSFSGQSNAPWQRNVMQVSSFHQGQTRPGPPQQQMFLQQAPQQSNMAFHGGLQAGGIFPPGSGAVSYPQPRSTGLNPVAFQQVAGAGGGGGQSQHYNSIGTVTKINSDCGLVNNEVFFYRNVCKGHAPKLGDRVLFEATYSSSGQFKWNATRIQLMPQQSHQPPPLMGSNVVAGNVSNKSGSGYNAVPPPNEYRGPPQHHRHNSPRRASPGRDRDRHVRNDREHRERERTHRSRDRDDDEHDRKRRREDRSRERISSTSRSGATAVARNDHRAAADREREVKLDRKDRERERERERERDRDREREKERSPHRTMIKGRRARTIRRYMVQIPKSILSYKYADVQELRQRYNTLYIPSDFFHANVKWSESFTLENPFPLSRPCQFHIMHKIVEPPIEQEPEETEPADADYLYSAKVMLMSCPPIADIYQKCFEDDDSDNEQHTVHPSRLIGFLVGTRGRNEPMAIGGPWSPSLDGENPDKDPAVLIRTAIRTCKALTGIDLSNCTQWYRFKELFYHRNDNKHKDKDAPPRIETVVVYLPDVHSCMPSAPAWQNLTQSYKTAVENVIARRTAACKASVAVIADDNSTTGAATLANNNSNADDEREADADIDGDGDGEGDAEVAAEAEVVQAESATAVDGDDDDDVTIIEEVDEQPTSSSVKGAAAAESTKDVAADGDENETEKDDSPEPTHYSQLDLKTMKVPEIRNELIARNLPSKGVRNLIMARLAKAINTEKADEVNSKKASAKKAKPNAKKVEEMEVDTTDTKEANETETPAEEPQEDQGEAEHENEANENENDDNEDWTDVIDVDMSDIVILDEYDSSKNPEETPKEMDEKEKSQLIRRYTLPSAPQIIVHPSKTAKGGKFDCSVMTLSVLLDYRPEDTKERFFEVSLFAELFNEMLQRDFGFNIYKELYVYKESIIAGESAASESKNEDANSRKDEAGDPEEDEKAKESTENKSNSDEASEKSARGRRTSKRSVDEEPEDDKQSAKSSADRKRKSTTSTSGRDKDKDKDTNADKKMVVAKPHLLLSFVYFDTSHCGYMFEKDLEDLFSILGLNLSRGQIRKVLGKLATRQAFYYRKLTDKEETPESIPTIEDADDMSIEELKKIALGNRQFDSVFNNNNTSSETGVSPTSDDNDGFINHNGAVIHVGKLVAQIKRTEKNYSDLEKLYNDIRRQHTDLQKDHSKSSGKIKDLQSEVKSLNRKLSDTDQGLSSINRKYRDQQSTLSYIYNRVAPYFNREKDKDHKSEGGRDKDADKDKDKHKDSKDSKDGKDSKDKERNKDKDLKDEEGNRKDVDKEKNIDKEKDESKSEIKDAENKKMVDENSKDDIMKE